MTKTTPQVHATLSDQNISLIVDGVPHVISKSHISYNKIIDALRSRDYSVIPALLDTKKAVETITEGLVTIKDGVVYFNGEEQHSSLTRRMLQMLTQGFDISHYVKFMNNLMLNPSHRSVQQLYNFMEACDLPITPDGRLLCYRSVKQNGFDSHTGKTSLTITYEEAIGYIEQGLHFKKIPNGPEYVYEHNGVVTIVDTSKKAVYVAMARNKVNDNPNETCSHGLHVCSQGYGNFSEKLYLVAVHPADVVSVPVDYKHAKMRVNCYEIVKCVQEKGFQTFEKAVYEGDEEDELSWEDFEMSQEDVNSYLNFRFDREDD